MPTYNYKSRELIAKIVYYGPGRCGKTTNLQQIHSRMRPETRSELLSVATETDRTIYFDLLPLNLGTISGMKFMVRLFTVPGQVYYSETRKLVLRGADGIVFVADSQDNMLDENRQALWDLKQNLAANGLDYNTIPLVFQYNKRDLPRLISEAEIDAALNDRHVKASTAIASEGTGVLETLRFVTLAVFNHIKAGGKTATERATPVPQQPASFPSPVQSTPLTGSGGALQRALAVAAAAAAPHNRHQPGASVSSGSMTPDSAPAARIPMAPASAAGPIRSGAYQTPPPPASGANGLNGPQAVRIGTEVVVEEFKNLAIMHSQMAERLAAVERELSRLGRENQEIREFLARQNQA